LIEAKERSFAARINLGVSKSSSTWKASVGTDWSRVVTYDSGSPGRAHGPRGRPAARPRPLPITLRNPKQAGANARTSDVSRNMRSSDAIRRHALIQESNRTPAFSNTSLIAARICVRRGFTGWIDTKQARA